MHTSNSDFIGHNRSQWRRLVKSPECVAAMASFGTHDAMIDESILTEADKKGIQISAFLPEVTLKGNTGLGRLSTARTLVCRELVEKHGSGAVMWTAIKSWNHRIIRIDLVPEYTALMRKQVGLD